MQKAHVVGSPGVGQPCLARALSAAKQLHINRLPRRGRRRLVKMETKSIRLHAWQSCTVPEDFGLVICGSEGYKYMNF